MKIHMSAEYRPFGSKEYTKGMKIADPVLLSLFLNGTVKSNTAPADYLEMHILGQECIQTRFWI